MMERKDNDDFCINVYSEGNFIAKEMTFNAPVNIGGGAAVEERPLPDDVEFKGSRVQEVQEFKGEELFHFVHPEVDSERELLVHYEVKRLVVRQGIQEICNHLQQMKKEGKLLLPQSPMVAYEELVRIGMPHGEGYSLKTFQRYYKK